MKRSKRYVSSRKNYRSPKPKFKHTKRRKKLKGYHLNTLFFRIGTIISVVCGSITILFFIFAVLAESGLGRDILLTITILFLILTFAAVFKVKRAHHFLNTYQTIHSLRKMDPLQFEHYVAHLHQKLGYKAKVVGESGDNGVDIELWEKGDYAVAQCKRYSGYKPIGSPEIQQFIGSMQIYNAPKGYFVATTNFTEPAQKLARSHHVELVDDVELTKLIQKAFR
jgi:HJR/Mrr/RecB family endonuclease